MRSRGCVALVAAAILLMVVGDSARAESGQPVPTKVQITVLYDAFGEDAGMHKDWGYAALIEYGGKRILFDTGNDPEILAGNAKAKAVDLSKLDFVVMSHRHSDHMGGLSYVLRVNPKVAIYAPKENFGVYGSEQPTSSYRMDQSLPAKQRYFAGALPATQRGGTAWPGANFKLIDKSTEIAPEIYLLTMVSEKPGTLEMREESLAINTPEGMIVVVGCSHPGIDKIVEMAAAINPHIHFIVGGLHLVAAPDPEVDRIVVALRDRFKVDYVAPGHCTGEPAFAALQKAFGDHYLYAGLGQTLQLARGQGTGAVR